MEITKEELRMESIERLKTLKLSKQCIDAFKSGNVWQSENGGFLYEVNEEVQGFIDELEKEHDGMVYHVVVSNHSEMGLMYCLLYTSKYNEEWEMDREDILSNYVFSYVVNTTIPEFSEFGSIVVQQSIGGLKRVG